jgi:NAD(P)-dependent dehydrogenase (short-subunit alcohol dehydrogenase family)
MSGRLAGKVAIVTGAGDGIGRGIAALFAREGARVVVNDISAAAATATTALIKADGGEAATCAGDVSDEAAAARLIEDAVATYGDLDVLVNNAGVLTFAPLLELTADAWDRVMTINTRSVFLCTRAAARYWVQTARPGKIVNMGSANAEMASLNGLAHYTASKGAIRMFTRTAAAELAQHRINVNAIGPGTIPTGIGMSAAREVSVAERTEMERRLAESIPVGRAGTPEDIAELALYLSLPVSDYLTGQHILIDGGRNLFAGPYHPV